MGGTEPEGCDSSPPAELRLRPHPHEFVLYYDS